MQIDTFFYACRQNNLLNSDKKPEKNLESKVSDDKQDDAVLLDGKALHDLYRHTTKLIK